MTIKRVLRNTPSTLSVTFYGDENPVDADGDVTVAAVAANGEILVNTTATKTPDTTGVYTVALPPQSELNWLTVEWSSTFAGAPRSVTTFAEIVGGHYFHLAEFRASDSSLSNTTKYPAARLAEVRAAVENEFEDICDRAFVPRYAREVVSGEGTGTIWLEHPARAVKSLTVGGVPRVLLAGESYAQEGRALHLRGSVFPYGNENIVVEYEHGFAVPPPEIKRVALKRARNMLVSGNARIDERATMMQVPDFGTFNLATPGKGNSYTGIPEVDAVLDRYRMTGGVY